MNTDLHIVIEARHNLSLGWTYRAVTPALPWRDAQEVWDRLDHERRNALYEHYYMVRADNDPTWAWLARPKIRRSPRTHGWAAREKAARDYGESRNIFGNRGGWLHYTHDPDNAICQGWATYASMCERNHLIRSIETKTGREWYAVASDLKPAPEAAKVSA